MATDKEIIEAGRRLHLLRMKRPRVIINPVADKHHAANERIVEFCFPDGTGGLISFGVSKNGKKRVEIYRCDEDIEVLAGSLI